MHTPVEDSHEVAQPSKLGAPVQLSGPLLHPEEQLRLYFPQEVTLDILKDLYARHYRILQHYQHSPLASAEAFIQCMQSAEFDVAVSAMADLGEWLEGFQLTIYAHLQNALAVPAGADALPLPPPPPPFAHEEAHPDA